MFLNSTCRPTKKMGQVHITNGSAAYANSLQSEVGLDIARWNWARAAIEKYALNFVEV